MPAGLQRQNAVRLSVQGRCIGVGVMRDNLDDALELMFGHEGGYVNRASDRGGPTKYGITHRTLAKHRGVAHVTPGDVQRLAIDEAEDIYRKSYWGPSGGDVLPPGLDYAAFDYGVNSGPQAAVKKLQQVLQAAGVYNGKIDGWIGEGTLSGVRNYPGGIKRLIHDYCEARMAFLRSLKNPKTGFPVNGRGWTIRVTGIDPKGQWARQPGVIGNALSLAGRQPVQPLQPTSMTVTDEGAAKAEEPKPNPWIKPDVLLPAGGAGATGAGTVLTSGMDPIRLAIAIGIITLVGLGAFYAYRRIRKEA
jgi:lysozyme family protein